MLGTSSEGGFNEDEDDPKKQTQHVNGAPSDFRVPVTQWGKTRIKGAAEAFLPFGWASQEQAREGR